MLNRFLQDIPMMLYVGQALGILVVCLLTATAEYRFRSNPLIHAIMQHRKNDIIKLIYVSRALLAVAIMAAVFGLVYQHLNIYVELFFLVFVLLEMSRLTTIEKWTESLPVISTCLNQSPTSS